MNTADSMDRGDCLRRTFLLKLVLICQTALSAILFLDALRRAPGLLLLIPAGAFLAALGVCSVYLLISLLQKQKNMEDYLLTKHEDCLVHGSLIWNSTELLFYQTIRESANRSRQMKILKKQAQYLALQNQINPHFLYNTLECIRSEALIHKVDTVANMTEALATFFRYTISDLDRLVPVSAELDNINNYYTIQHYRFGSRLSLKIDMEGDTNQIPGLYIPKLTLQPVVENAVFHGIEKKAGAGEVVIHFILTQQRLLIQVSDNGVGMPPHTLNTLNDRLARNIPSSDTEKGGIAISNVNERIKLLFGDIYGIYIRSIPGEGTDVNITLPIVRSKDEVTD